MSLLREIISGGQTGVDRAALDAAIAAGLAHGGRCPRGRRAEDGAIPRRYSGLRETPSAAYHVRTERNVVDSDATLIIYRQRLHGGTSLTRRLALDHKRPHLLVDLQQNPDPAAVAAWIRQHDIGCLNVAGPRESSCPGIHQDARRFLDQVLLQVIGE